MPTAAGSERSQPPFGLSFVNGRGIVVLTQHAIKQLARLDLLEMEIPSLRFPFDISGGADHFRHRRCTLRQATITSAGWMLERWLSERLEEARYGYRDLRLRLHNGLFEITGLASIGIHNTDFVFRGFLHPGPRGTLEICLCDLRLFDQFPVPAPLLAGGLLQAIGSQVNGDPDEHPPLELIGATDARFDPLRLALLHTLPLVGWRLPSMPPCLESVRLSTQEVRLDYRTTADRQPAVEAIPPPPERFVAVQRAKQRYSESEALIRAGETAAAIEAYRTHLAEAPGDAFVAERLLQLLVADPAHDEETIDFAAHADQLPEPIQPLLAEATVLMRQHAYQAAAARYRQLANLAASSGSGIEEILAVLAAGRCALGINREAALSDFERVVELQPDHPRALTQLARLYAEGEKWNLLAETRRKQIAVAHTAEQRQRGYLALGEIYRVHLDQPQLAREQYERVLDDDPDSEPALQGLAEACIDADEPMKALKALERLCSLASEREDQEAEVAIHLRVASLWEHLGNPANALARLQHARLLWPDEPQILRRNADLLLVMDRSEEAATVLHQLADVTENPADSALIHRQLAEVYLDRLNDAATAQWQIERALSIESANAATRALAVRVAEAIGDEARVARALELAAETERSPGARASLLFRRGLLLLRQQQVQAAITTLQEAADCGDVDGWRASRELGAIHEQLGDLTAARAAWSRAQHTSHGEHDPEGWYRLGRVEIQQGLYEEAIVSLRRAVSHDSPWLAVALQGLATACNEMGDPAGQRQALEALLLVIPWDELDGAEARRIADLLSELSRLRADNGDLAGALDVQARAVNLQPDRADLLDGLAALHERHFQWDLARDVLLQLRERLADAPAAERAGIVLRLAAVAAEQRRYQEAIEYFHDAIALGLDPSVEQHACDEIIRLHLGRGDPVAAARDIEATSHQLARPEARAERLYQAGRIWLDRASRRDEGIRCFEEALQQYSYHQGALEALTEIWTEEGKDGALADILQLATEAAETEPELQKDLLGRLAQVQLRLGLTQEARASYTKALALDETFLPALGFLAREARASAQGTEAARWYQRVIDTIQGGDADELATAACLEAHLELAEIARESDDPAVEEQHLQDARRLDPRALAPIERLERLLREQQRHDELIELLSVRGAAAQTEQEVTRLALQRADLLVRLSRFDEAITVYRGQMRRSPNNRAVSLALANALREAGQWDELLELLEALAPSAEEHQAVELWTEAGQVARRLGQLDRAVQSLDKALARSPEHLPALDPLLSTLRETGESKRLDELLTRRISIEAERERRLALRAEQAELREQRGDTESAIDLLHEAIDQGEYDGDLLLLAGRLNEQLQRWQGAAECYDLLRRSSESKTQEAHAIRLLLRLMAGPLQLMSAPSWSPAGEVAGHPQLQAEKLCCRLLELQPGDRETLERLATIRQQRENWPGAVSALSQLLEQLELRLAPASEQIEVAAQLAWAQHCAGESPEPILSRAVRGAINDDKAMLRLADLAQQLGLEEVESGCLWLLVERDAEPSALLARLAQIYQRRGQLPEATRALERALLTASAESRAPLIRQLLDCADESKEPTLVLEALARLPDDEITSAERWRRARLLAQVGNSAAALEALDELADDTTVDATERRTMRWRLLRATGDFERLASETEAWARQLTDPLERAGGLVQAVECWGLVPHGIDRAVECALDAAVLQPKNLERIDRLCSVLADAGGSGAAVGFVETFARPAGACGKPLQAQLLCRSAELKRAAGAAWPEIESTFRQALQRNANCVEAIEGLIAAFREQADAEKLVEMLRLRGEVGADPSGRIDALVEGAAVLFLTLGRPQDALALLRRAREMGDTAAALRLCVEIHLSLKDSPAAEAALAALADAGEQPEESLTRAASLARLRDDRQAEIRHLRRLWQLQPDNLQLGWRLVEACADAGDLPGRRAILERLAPRDPEARRQLQATDRGRPPTGEEPGRLQIRPERPVEDLDDGDWQSLAAALRQQAARETDLHQRARLLMRLGQTLEGGLGRPLEALEAFREAAAAAEDLDVLEALADAAYRQRDWRQAKEAYDRVWALQPDGPARGETAYRRGLVYENLGIHDVAEQCYRTAIDLRPDHRAALEAQARMALHHDDVATAIETLTALSQLLNADEFENIAELRQRLGELHLRRGDLDMARAYLEAALELDSRSFKTLQLLLRVHEKANNHDEAVSVLRQLDFRTEDPMIRASLLHHQALLLSSALGDDDRAIECLLKAYDVAPNHIPTLWRLLDYYWSQGDMRAVVEIGEELKKQDVLTDDVPDRRHARLGGALLLAQDDMRRAQALVGIALSETELVDLVLLDLASLVEPGDRVEKIATLLVALDEDHALRDRAAELAEAQPGAPGLPLLIDEIFGRTEP